MLRPGRLLYLRSRATDSVDHFYSRVLSVSAVSQASVQAHRDLYDKYDAVEKIYKSEFVRVASDVATKPIKVEVPNQPEIKILYSVATVTPADIEQHFTALGNKSPFTPIDATEMLEELLSKFDRSKVMAQISLWGTKTFADAGHEVEEVLALLHLIHQSVEAADGSVLNRNFQGSCKTALVVPATNFPLLALKDAVWLIMQGYRVVLGVQPRYFRMYEDLLNEATPSASSKAIISLLPLLTRQNEAALERSVQLAAAFRFTGNSKLFKKLYSLGLKSNRRLDGGGEISGINRTVLHESLNLESVDKNSVVVEGLHWSITANNGELCSSTSMVESSLSPGQVNMLSKALHVRDQTPGIYGDYKSGKLLIRKDKQKALQLLIPSPKTEPEVKEYWDKTAMFVPRNFGDTYNALTHCVYASTLGAALRQGVKAHASNVYVCAAPEDGSSLPRVGTTGAKIPESIFGSMRSYTNAVGGNHDGVGTAQWLLSLVRTRMSGGRKSRLSNSLPEEVEQLCDFLSEDRDRQVFINDRIPEILDVMYFFAKNPEIHGPYAGQPLVHGQGVSNVVSLKAIRSSIKQFVLPLSRTSPAEASSQLDHIVKSLVIEQLSPWRANRLPVLHLVELNNPLSESVRSFLRFVENNGIANLVHHESWESLANNVKNDALPPYFHAVPDVEKLASVFVQSVAERAGFIYEGFPADALAVFRESTTSQAWACGVKPDEVAQTKELLKEVYELECFKTTPWKPVALHIEPSEEDQEVAMEQEGGKS